MNSGLAVDPGDLPSVVWIVPTPGTALDGAEVARADAVVGGLCVAGRDRASHRLRRADSWRDTRGLISERTSQPLQRLGGMVVAAVLWLPTVFDAPPTTNRLVTAISPKTRTTMATSASTSVKPASTVPAGSLGVISSLMLAAPGRPADATTGAGPSTAASAQMTDAPRSSCQTWFDAAAASSGARRSGRTWSVVGIAPPAQAVEPEPGLRW